MSDASADRVRFGVFEVDLRSGELRKAGSRVALQEQPFRILARLLSRPGELVTREELRQELWPADTFVDFEHGLNAAIKRLRDALGDAAEAPRFIETLPRRGYRFLAPVNGAAEGGRQVSARRPASLHQREVVMALVLGVAVAGIGWMLTDPSSAPQPIDPAPLTSFPGSETQPVLSPDGRYVAFLWREETVPLGKARLCVMRIGAEQPLILSSAPEEIGHATWSPDGEQLAFMRHGNDPSGLSHHIIVVPALGGPERRIATVLSFGHGLAWSRDGRFLVVPNRTSPDDSDSLFLLSTTGEMRHLTVPPAGWSDDSFPAISPDGRIVAFARGPDLLSRDIYVAPIEGGEARRLTSISQVVLGLDWTSDGRAVVFGAGPRLSRMYLWRVAGSGGHPERLPFGEDGRFPSVARTGGRLVYMRVLMDANIWRTAGPALPRRQTGEQFIASTRQDLWPQYSPDGKKVLFESDRSGEWQAWMCNDQGSECRQLTKQGTAAGNARASAASNAWSPDGRTVAITFGRGEAGEIHAVSVDGGLTRRVTDVQGSVAGWSRDGRWIYFHPLQSGAGPPQPSIWKVSSGGGVAIAATADAQSFGPIESDDGRYLYYQKGTLGGTIWRVSLNSGVEQRVLDKFVQGGNWTLWRHLLLYVSLEQKPEPAIAIMQLDLGTGRSEVVAHVGARPDHGLTVSPDGRWILYSQQDQAGADLMVVENFR